MITFTIRLPQRARDKLKSAADRQGRSMNSQLLWMIGELKEAEKENASEGESSEASKPSPNPIKDKEISYVSY